MAWGGMVAAGGAFVDACAAAGACGCDLLLGSDAEADSNGPVTKAVTTQPATIHRLLNPAPVQFFCGS
jgi:hypothetical protein